jgi:GR25 family glycosyltransferase involved in LPS biosynthesis
MRVLSLRLVDETSMLILWSNLDIRPDRREWMQNQLDRLGIEAHRIAAVDGYRLKPSENELPTTLDIEKRTGTGAYIGPNAFGATCSMAIAISIAKWYQAPWFVYLEDDAILFEGFEEVVEMYVKKMPDDWDVLSLGGVCWDKPVPVNRLIARPSSKRVSGSHCFVFRGTSYDKILPTIGTGPPIGSDSIINTNPELSLYVLEYNLIGQKDGYSDTMLEYMDNSSVGKNCLKSGNHKLGSSES